MLAGSGHKNTEVSMLFVDRCSSRAKCMRGLDLIKFLFLRLSLRWSCVWMVMIPKGLVSYAGTRMGTGRRISMLIRLGKLKESQVISSSPIWRIPSRMWCMIWMTSMRGKLLGAGMEELRKEEYGRHI